MTLSNSWASQCAKFLSERMSSRFSHRWPHLGVLGPPFPDQIQNIEDNEENISQILEKRYKESGTFRYAPNVAQAEFFAEGGGKFRFITSFFYRNQDATHKSPIGHKYNENEDKEFFNEVKLDVEVDLKSKDVINKFFINNKEEETNVIKTEEKNKLKINIPLCIDSLPFKRFSENKDRPYNYELSLQVVFDFKEGGNILVNYKFLNLSKEGLIYNKVEMPSDKEYTYIYGQLYEFMAELKLENTYIIEKSERSFSRLNNVTAEINKEGNRILLKDNKVITEIINGVNDSDPPSDVFKKINNTKFLEEQRKHILCQELADTFQKEVPEGLGFNKLRLFQDLSIQRIMDSWESSDRGWIYPTIIKTRTAAGKTEAFMIPTLQYCIESTNAGEIGCNSIIFYPTKALANDQANRFHKIIYFLNKRLKNKISLGILHGDIGKTNFEEDYLIFTCPICDKRLKYNDKKDMLICPTHEEVEIDYLRLTKNEIYSNPPNIIVTNPDMINYILLNNPEAHSIFGRTVGCCLSCKQTYSSLRKNICENCRDMGIKHEIKKYIPTTVPKFIIFDEVHLLKGTLGSHVAYLISRLKETISEYSKEINPESKYTPILIGSTATIKDSEKFSKEIFGVKDVNEIPSSDEEATKIYNDKIDEKTIHRVHLFAMPFSYTPDAFMAMSVKRIWDWWQEQEFYKKDNNKRPRILTFVNSISDANNLISSIRNQVPNLRVNGHNTDFNKKDRINVEKKFNKGELDVLIATRTLEVGVDFEELNILFIFGSPYSYNDYIQRIGRSGRKSNALVINIFKPYMPIDNFYYENCEELVIQKKREKNIEYVPIKRKNPKIIEKTHIHIIIDFIMSQLNSYTLKEDINKIGLLLQDKSFILKIEKRAKDILNDDFDENLFSNLINEFKNDIREALKTSSKYRDLFNIINGKYFVTNMRYSDKEVPLQIEPFRRERFGENFEMESTFVRSRAQGYCVSKLFKDAAVSYRGYTLQVDTIETEKTFGLTELLYNQLYRKVMRNPLLRKHIILPSDYKKIVVHEPKMIDIKWGVFNVLRCKKCGHLQYAYQGFKCLNCQSTLTNAPVISMINERFREPEIIKVDNIIIKLRQRNCVNHGLVYHIKVLNPELPIESLSWVCPLCRPDLVGNSCKVCSDLMRKKNER